MLYGASFLGGKKNHRTLLKTAYVNAKNEDKINQIWITKNESTLILQKQAGIWYVVEEKSSNFIPADSKKVQNFINELIKVRNLYKISDRIKAGNAFGFDSPDGVTVKYQTEAAVYPRLYFGSLDFAQISRYFMTEKNTAVYQSDTNLDVYLSSSVQMWSEPFIFSQNLSSIQDARSVQTIKIEAEEKKSILDSSSPDFYDVCSRFMEFRHGGPFSAEKSTENSDEKSDLKLTFSLGNKAQAEFSFYQLEEGLVKVFCKYNFERSASSVSYDLKISSWTYNKIKEIML